MGRFTPLLLCCFLLPSPSVLAQTDPPAGNWKVVLPLQTGSPGALWLVQFEEKEGAWTGNVLAQAEGVQPAKLSNIRARQGKLRFALDLRVIQFQFQGDLPKEKGGKILGSITVRDNVIPAELHPTRMTGLSKAELNKELLEGKSEGTEVVRAAIELLQGASEQKAKVEEVRGWADKAVRAAEPYGAWSRSIILEVAEMLSQQKEYAAVALQYARQAERLIEPTDSIGMQKRTLTTLATALDLTGRPEDAAEAKKVRERNEKLPWVNVKKFEGRKEKSDRVILLELFTGAECPPCIAADLAFEAVQKTFAPTEVVLLQYHLHIPGPDPLTNPDSERRARFYGRAVEGTPTVFFNGKPAAEGGGGHEDAQAKYEEYLDVLTPLLEKPAQAKLSISATLKEEEVGIKVDVSDLAQTGPDVRLRMALVEQQVNYKGRNQVPEHHCVVRHFPGGVDGASLKEKASSHQVTVKLGEVRKQLEDYLKRTETATGFPNKDRPLELKNLRVVAFVQNDETGEVLQAGQVEVKGE